MSMFFEVEADVEKIFVEKYLFCLKTENFLPTPFCGESCLFCTEKESFFFFHSVSTWIPLFLWKKLSVWR